MEVFHMFFGSGYVLKKIWINRRNFEQHQGIEERFIWGRTFLEEKFLNSTKPCQHYIHLLIINSLLEDALRLYSFS